jgi:hypothetical protein
MPAQWNYCSISPGGRVRLGDPVAHELASTLGHLVVQDWQAALAADSERCGHPGMSTILDGGPHLPYFTYRLLI